MTDFRFHEAILDYIRKHNTHDDGSEPFMGTEPYATIKCVNGRIAVFHSDMFGLINDSVASFDSPREAFVEVFEPHFGDTETAERAYQMALYTLARREAEDLDGASASLRHYGGDYASIDLRVIGTFDMTRTYDVDEFFETMFGVAIENVSKNEAVSEPGHIGIDIDDSGEVAVVRRGEPDRYFGSLEEFARAILNGEF